LKTGFREVDGLLRFIVSQPFENQFIPSQQITDQIANAHFGVLCMTGKGLCSVISGEYASNSRLV
jgi:hypothetical protein